MRRWLRHVLLVARGNREAISLAARYDGKVQHVTAITCETARVVEHEIMRRCRVRFDQRDRPVRLLEVADELIEDAHAGRWPKR